MYELKIENMRHP